MSDFLRNTSTFRDSGNITSWTLPKFLGFYGVWKDICQMVCWMLPKILGISWILMHSWENSLETPAFGLRSVRFSQEFLVLSGTLARLRLGRCQNSWDSMAFLRISARWFVGCWLLFSVPNLVCTKRCTAPTVSYLWPNEQSCHEKFRKIGDSWGELGGHEQ